MGRILLDGADIGEVVASMRLQMCAPNEIVFDVSDIMWNSVTANTTATYRYFDGHNPFSGHLHHSDAHTVPPLDDPEIAAWNDFMAEVKANAKSRIVGR